MNIYSLRNYNRSNNFIHCLELEKDESPTEKKRTFRCFICKRILSTKATLKKHILRKHFKLKPHYCRICDKKFVFERDLDRHKVIHNDTTCHKCFCGQTFKTYSSYMYHQRRSHKPYAPLKCYFCSRDFTDKLQLKSHLQTTHLPKTIKCSFPFCKRVFSTEALLRHHEKIHTSIRYECPICKKKFKLKKYMELHKSSHEGSRPYKCSDCEKSYISVSHVNEHWKRTHSQIRNFLCSMCGLMFKSKYDVVVHENSHLDKVFSCDKCDYNISSKHLLNSHMKSSHRPSAIEPETQMKAHSSRLHLQRNKKNISHYVNVPSDSTPFKCVDCEKCFKSAIRANEHWRRSHTSRNKSEPGPISRNFEGKDDLESHQDFDFKCDECSFETMVENTFLSHQKIHEKYMTSGKELLTPTTKAEITNKDPKLNRNSANLSLQKSSRLNNAGNKKSFGEVHDPSSVLQSQYLEQGRHRTKKRMKKLKPVAFESLTGNFSEMNFFGEEGCNKFSDDLLFDQPILPYIDLNNTVNIEAPPWCLDKTTITTTNSNNNNEPLSSRTDIDSKNCIDHWSGHKRNSKITLNCTAVNGLFEDTELLELQNF